jgi:hypothetical protein
MQETVANSERPSSAFSTSKADVLCTMEPTAKHVRMVSLSSVDLAIVREALGAKMDYDESHSLVSTVLPSYCRRLC